MLTVVLGFARISRDDGLAPSRHAGRRRSPDGSVGYDGAPQGSSGPAASRALVGDGVAAAHLQEKTMRDDNLCHLGVHDLAGCIQRREVSPVETVEAHLRRIEALNPRFSAFFTVTADRALDEARRAEAEIAAGRWRGPLHGVPYGAKDIMETAGVLTTHGSSFFRDHVPAEDAECIVRLRQAGAILLGKTLTHELASAATTINPHYGTAHT